MQREQTSNKEKSQTADPEQLLERFLRPRSTPAMASQCLHRDHAEESISRHRPTKAGPIYEHSLCHTLDK